MKCTVTRGEWSKWQQREREDEGLAAARRAALVSNLTAARAKWLASDLWVESCHSDSWSLFIADNSG